MNFLPSMPTLKISPKNFTFNAACMKLLPDTDYVEFNYSFADGILFARGCAADKHDGVTSWRRNCSSREVRAKIVKWPAFYKLVCEGMHWPLGDTYTIPAGLDTYEDESVILFELNQKKSANETLIDREFKRLAESELLSEDEGISIRIATAEDADSIAQHDKHIATEVLSKKIDRQEVYVAYDGDELIGWLRYSLFWDNTPFMNMIYLLPEHRGEGNGRQLVEFWEERMKAQGYRTLMTSTQQNESAQHFYLHMGYKAIGGFALPGDEYEIILAKEIT